MAAIPQNRLQRQLRRLDKVPAAVRPWAQSLLLGRAVPYTGTSNLRYEVMLPEKVVISVTNSRKVQNHINGVHAVATTLAAETATGMVMGMNVRDDCVPVVKDMRVQFKKRGMGNMRAVATLTAEQRALIKSTEKGEVTVAVVVTDDSGNQPVVCEFIWAWIPSKRSTKPITQSAAQTVA